MADSAPVAAKPPFMAKNSPNTPTSPRNEKHSTSTAPVPPARSAMQSARSKLTRDAASSQVYDALRRLKALLEAGEIPTTEGQPAGGPQRKAKGKR